MIITPTTELIGCLADVLPQITDPKSSLAGVKVEWDGEALHFTTYDTYSAATVTWLPGEGAEGEIDADADDSTADDIAWGGEDGPWKTWIGLAAAKDIVKLFQLPAKLWRFPVSLKCSPTGDRLIVEREDGPRVGRMLMAQADPTQLKNIPDVRAVAGQIGNEYSQMETKVSYAAARLGAFGTVRPHGQMQLTFGMPGQPTAVHIGTRVAGFIYPSGVKGVRPYNFLRDGAGMVAVTREPADPRPADDDSLFD